LTLKFSECILSYRSNFKNGEGELNVKVVFMHIIMWWKGL
jgi:hypothetical protein